MKVFVNDVWHEQDAINTFQNAIIAWYQGNADAAASGESIPVGNVVCDGYLTQSYHYDPDMAPPADGSQPQPTCFDGVYGWATYSSIKFPNDNPVISGGVNQGPLPTPTA